MKQIKLRSLTAPAKHSIRKSMHTYSLLLDWGVKYSFSNKKQAAAFQNRLNDWLNNQFYLLNEHYINCFTAYRRAWLYMDREKLQEKQVNKSLALVALWLDQLTELPQTGPDAAFRCVERLSGCLDQLAKVYEILKVVQRRRNEWAALKLLDYQAGMLQAMNAALVSRLQETGSFKQDPGGGQDNSY